MKGDDAVYRMQKVSRAKWISLAASWVVFSFFAAAGCMQKNGDAKSDAKSESAPEGSKEASNQGPCAEYASKLCQVVGENTPSCKEIQNTTDLMPENACKAGMSNIDHSKSKYAEKQKICNELVDKLCGELGSESESCEMVRTQSKNFPPDRCEMLMKNYDRVLTDLKRREEANKPLDEENQKLIAADAPGSFGPKDAKVSIVEFSDFQCPYCAKAGKVVKQLKEKYGKQVRFVFRHFPLSFHKDAHLASQAALAAGEQDKFFEYHDILFDNAKSLKRKDLEGYAKKIGLNMGKFNQALDNKTFAKAVDDDIELGKKVSVNGTPTMFLNGQRVKNPSDFDQISKDIDKLLK